MPAGSDITQLLCDLKSGDEDALSKLMPLVYDELHNLARHHLSMRSRGRGAAGQTLQTTALVHEAYLRLAKDTDPSWTSRVHFFAVAAKAMRSVLVDYARRSAAAKRSSGGMRMPFDQALAVFQQRDIDILALDQALAKLAAIDQRKCRTVELRFFGGLTNEESAVALGVSEPTIERDWRMARAWLRRELNGADRKKGEA